MEQKVAKTTKTIVACEGHDPRFGHPRVYIKLEHGQRAQCPYCSKVFENTVKK